MDTNAPGKVGDARGTVPSRGSPTGERRAGGCEKGDAEQEEGEGAISPLPASPASKKPSALGRGRSGGLLFRGDRC